jgi:hypothetical protein
MRGPATPKKSPPLVAGERRGELRLESPSATAPIVHWVVTSLAHLTDQRWNPSPILNISVSLICCKLVYDN